LKTARSLLASVARKVPEPIVRTLGRRAGPHRLLGFVDTIARSLMNGDVEIPRGEAAGLRFNAAGGRAGFGLGTWEPEVQAAFAELSTRGAVVYDLGAATGFYTIIAARCVGVDGKVIAFEPAHANVSALRHNVALNSFENVAIFDLAIADYEGRAEMVQEANDDINIVMHEIDESREVGVDEVAVTSLDTLLEAGRIPAPSVIKMDVEGAELEVIAGAKATLSRHRPILLIEVHERWDELEPMLSESGYTYRPLEGVDPADASRAVHIVATPVDS
jgi:FkbM family methyltransferase